MATGLRGRVATSQSRLEWPMGYQITMDQSLLAHKAQYRPKSGNVKSRTRLDATSQQ
jgi:hypothetical protein